MRVLASSVLSALGLLALCAAGPSAAAEIQPSSRLLVPWIEVDLNDPGAGLTTLFAVCNHDPGAIEVLATVHTNWGIPLFETSLILQGGELRTFNLRDWIVRGALPDRTLSAGELAHLQAALSGRPSPADGLHYGTPAGPGLAVGYVTLDTMGGRLWGDYYEVDGRRATFLAATLVDLEPAGGGALAACARHAVRFLNSPAVAHGTRLLVWTGRQGVPSPSPRPERSPMAAGIEVYDEPGSHVEDRALGLLPVEVVEVDDLGLQPGFGWLEIETGEPSFITQHVRTPSSGGAILQAWCLPPEAQPPGPEPVASLALEAMINGDDADFPPGPEIPIFSYIRFDYRVENTGDVQLVDVEVAHSGQATMCPKKVLEPSESMTCSSFICRFCQALPGQYSAVVMVTARAPWGTISAEDPVHYFGRTPSLQLVLLTNGLDVAAPPGPSIPVGAPVTWQYVVTNTGPTVLVNVKVTDDQGVAVSCPKDDLQWDETMVCTASGTVQAGQYKNKGTVTSRVPPYPSGPSASDVSYCFGVPE